MGYGRKSPGKKLLFAAVLLAAVTGGIRYVRYAAETAADREVYTAVAEVYHRSSAEYRELLENHIC